MSSPLTRISKAPPPDAINLGVTPAVLRMRAAKLAALGSKFQTVQYSIVTSDFTRASFIFSTLCARDYAVES